MMFLRKKLLDQKKKSLANLVIFLIISKSLTLEQIRFLNLRVSVKKSKKVMVAQKGQKYLITLVGDVVGSKTKTN